MVDESCNSSLPGLCCLHGLVVSDASCMVTVAGLPKTRSGKIMRRVLRKIATKQEKELGDLSTLSDPETVKQLIELRGK